MKWVVVAALMVVSIGQTPQPKYRTGVEVVRVDVLVTDSNTPVAGLTSDDFELKDRGVPQKIDAAAIVDVPVSMLLTLDTSSSVKGNTLAGLKDAAHAAVAQLGSSDRAALIAFSTIVEMAVPWGQGAASIREGINKSEAGGGTSLYDAAFAALTMRDQEPGYRGLVVLFSDGADTTSWLTSAAVLEKARQTDAVVYTIGLGEAAGRMLYRRSGIELLDRPISPIAAKPFLGELADVTGGKTFVAESADRLRDAFAKVVAEFRTRYLLTYTPQGVDAAGWHPIEVKLKSKKGRISARRGYSRAAGDAR
jgi:VWFA-related protein